MSRTHWTGVRDGDSESDDDRTHRGTSSCTDELLSLRQRYVGWLWLCCDTADRVRIETLTLRLAKLPGRHCGEVSVVMARTLDLLDDLISPGAASAENL